MKLLKNQISGDWGLFCYKDVQFDWHKEVRSAANEQQSERETFYSKIGGEKEKLGTWVDTTKAKEELKKNLQYTFSGKELVSVQLARHFGEPTNEWSTKNHSKTFTTLDLITKKYPVLNVDNPQILSGKTIQFLGQEIQLVDMTTGEEIKEEEYISDKKRKGSKNKKGTGTVVSGGNEKGGNGKGSPDKKKEHGPNPGDIVPVEYYQDPSNNEKIWSNIDIKKGDLTPNIEEHNENIEKNIPGLKEVVGKYEKYLAAGQKPFDALKKALKETPHYTLTEEGVDFLVAEYRRSLIASDNKERTAESFAKRNAELVKVAQLAIEARQLKVALNNQDIITAETAFNILEEWHKKLLGGGAAPSVNEEDFADIRWKKKREKAIKEAKELLALGEKERLEQLESDLEVYQNIITEKRNANTKSQLIIDGMIAINDVKNKDKALYFPVINPKEITFEDVTEGSELLQKLEGIQKVIVRAESGGVANLEIFTSLREEIEKKQMIKTFREKVKDFGPESSPEERNEVANMLKDLRDKGVADTEIMKGLDVDEDVLTELSNELDEMGRKKQAEELKESIEESLKSADYIKGLKLEELINLKPTVDNILFHVDSVGRERFEAEMETIEAAELIYDKMESFQSMTAGYLILPEAMKGKDFINNVDLNLYPEANRKMGKLRQDISNTLRSLYGDASSTRSGVVFNKFETESQKEMQSEFEAMYVKKENDKDFFEKMKQFEDNFELLKAKVEMEKQMKKIKSPR